MATVDRPEPVYLQIAKQIADRIESGQLAPGDPVPSIREIMSEWGVANATAARVVRHLRSRGLISGEPGKNSIVATPASSPQAYAISVMKHGRIYPDGHYAKILSSELVPAPDHIVDALALEPGAHAIRRERVTYSPEDKPLSTSVSWFDGALAPVAPLLLETGRILQGTTQYAADTSGRGRSPREAVSVVSVDATEAVAELLGLAVGTSISRCRNTYWDANDVPLEFGESFTTVPQTFVYEVAPVPTTNNESEETP